MRGEPLRSECVAVALFECCPTAHLHSFGGVRQVHDLEGSDLPACGAAARLLRLSTMDKIRKQVDALEACIPASMWTLATYEDLWFIDQNTE